MGYLTTGVRGLIRRADRYLDHRRPPRWLRLLYREEGLLVSYRNYAGPNRWVSFLSTYTFIHASY
ncbi:hypothetical protein HU200_008831 [Digitaria exilis]|uniref:Uncharacterized protein n=1 Tax=Digitaria exilis TaxID=1010633 RepID=A0A835FKY8_9POAL|nr:hypothetical protein HU200_008831 [Digitaria exilis]